jgi:hypothetical protein
MNRNQLFLDICACSHFGGTAEQNTDY